MAMAMDCVVCGDTKTMCRIGSVLPQNKRQCGNMYNFNGIKSAVRYTHGSYGRRLVVSAPPLEAWKAKANCTEPKFAGFPRTQRTSAIIPVLQANNDDKTRMEDCNSFDWHTCLALAGCAFEVRFLALEYDDRAHFHASFTVIVSPGIQRH